MSKEQFRKQGWINFTGLRFIGKFATREDVVREIRDFFARRNIKF